jgi:hypothetical protein
MRDLLNAKMPWLREWQTGLCGMVEMREFLVRVVRSYVGLLDAPLLWSRPRTSEFRSMRRRKHSHAAESVKAGFVAE